MNCTYAYTLMHSKAYGFCFYDETGKQWGYYSTGEEAVRMMDEIMDRFQDAATPAEVEFPKGEFAF